MSDLLDRRGALASLMPAGPAQSDDATVYTTGVVYAVDPVKATVQVGVRGGTVTLPAIADRYVSGGLARVLMDPIQTRPVLVAGAVDPAKPAVIAGVFSTGTGTVTVQYQATSYTIPTASGTYTAGQSAWIILDEWGIPVVAVGPSTQLAPGYSGATPPGGGSTIAATAIVGPQASGTWRVDLGRWDSWNTDRYGGAADVYQGSWGGSGPFYGWAGYGDQIVNLGATTIDNMTLTLVKQAGDGLAAAPVVQGSAAGTRPSGSPVGGPWGTATPGVLNPGASGYVALPAALCDAFRTGAAKSLVAVGSDYGAFGGTSTPGAFVLQIAYTRPA